MKVLNNITKLILVIDADKLKINNTCIVMLFK